jgi:AraC-like DNA-binding protein
VNTALMRSRRGQGEVERLRAEAIHDWKLEQSGVLRQGFVHLEPELVLAIRRGDRPEARRILNALLMHIFNASRGELSRVTGLIAELLALMRITVRDCGVTVEEAAMFREPVMETLTRMRDEEELSPWLHQQLEGWMDLVASSAARPAALRARLILDYIARNASRPLGRAEVASKAGLSEAEFSRMLRRVTGRSFSEHLLKLRIDQACSLLRSSGLTLEEISGRCGFESASYFSRRFRQETGISPSQYRKNLFAEVDRGQPE